MADILQNIFKFIFLNENCCILIQISLNFGYQDSNGLEKVLASAITWSSVDPDLCHHMVSLGCNKLNKKSQQTPHIPLLLYGWGE